MKYTHLLRTLTASALAALLLVSCGGGQTAETTVPTESTTEATATEAPARVVTLVEGGKSEFVIYRSKSLGDVTLTAVNKLVNAIRAETGVTVKIVTDWGDAGEKDEQDCYAILVGETSFRQSDALNSLKLTQSLITLDGNKLIIGGRDDESTAGAVEKFIKEFVTGKGQTLTFSEDQSVLDTGKYPNDSYLSCLGEPIEHYRIVIPADADFAVRRCAIEVSSHLSKLTGVVYDILTDAEATDSGAYEILIGKTARTTVEPKPYSYDISAKGKTLQIVADSIYAYEEATYVLTTDMIPLRKPLDITEETWRRQDMSAELKQTGPAIFERSGEVRVLIQNIWGNTSSGNIDGRMLQTTAIYDVYRPDVIGLQECSPGARGGNNGIIKLLAGIGYTEVPAKSTNSSGNNYTPLLYNPETVKLIEYGYRLYEGQNDSGSKGLTWAVFETLATGERFGAISTHFWWQSDDAQDTRDRESNAREMLDTVASIQAKYNCPVVSGGDFNCNPSSSPYGIITSGGMRDVQSWAKLTENMHTHHTYPTFNETTGLWDDPVYPSANYSRSIDHIFATTENITPKRYDVVTDLYAVLSSDHCPMILDFDLN